MLPRAPPAPVPSGTSHTVLYLNTAGSKRISRQESQARTRSRLIEAAAAEFATNGLEQTSVERIATRSGFTRGAFYAHFADKTAISLALLEERFDRYVRRFAQALATDEDAETRARKAGDDFSLMVEQGPEAQQLLFEFAVHALHHEGFRGELVARLVDLRKQVAEVFRRRAAAYGIEPPIPIDRLTLMTFATANGIALAKLLEPEQFDDALYGDLLGLLFAGLGEISRRSDVAQRAFGV